MTCQADPSSKRGQFLATVVANNPLCHEHFRLVVRLEHFPATRPGQFVQVACRDLSLNYSPEFEFDWQAGMPPVRAGLELMAPLAFLRRPFSLAGRHDRGGGVELELIYRDVGIGTKWLVKLAPGSGLHILGPLGNHFQWPEQEKVAILVGGGVGIPPMLYLAAESAGRRAVAFCGALDRELLPLTITADAPSPGPQSAEPLYNIAEFSRHGVPAVITTNNGSYGFKGLITDALERYLDQYFKTGRGCVIYTCGPEAMMKRVGQIALERGIECQISVERAMACGMGTCQSCCIKVKKPDPSRPPLAGQEWAYRLACTDGPVFRASELMW